MKITLLAHASILIETNGIRILSDPWWGAPCFGSQWWNYPDPYLSDLDAGPIDYIYVSHGHHDHFHPPTLARMDRTSKVLVSNQLDLAKAIDAMGFDVIALDPDEDYDLAGAASVRIRPTHGQDTLFTLNDGKEVCINLNDALHSAPSGVQKKFIEQLKASFERITYVFCGYGTASHFPNCYSIPGKNFAATAMKRQRYFNRQWVNIIDRLQPTFGFPFAADVVFFERDLAWLNEVVHNSERPTDVYRSIHPRSNVQVIDIAPGFCIENSEVKRLVERQPINQEELERKNANAVTRANSYDRANESGARNIAQMLRNNIEVAKDYLLESRGNFTFLIELRGSEFGIAIRKINDIIDVDVVTEEQYLSLKHDLKFTTRLSYLRQSLTKPYGNEILFVGSGGIFEYPSRKAAESKLHHDFRVILARQNSCPSLRYGRTTPLIYQLKQRIKKMLGLSRPSLYDLNEWTVFR